MRIVVTFFRSDFLTKGKGAVAAFVLFGKLLELVWLLPVFPTEVTGAVLEARTVFFCDGSGEGDCPRPHFERRPSASSDPVFRLSLLRSLGLGPRRLKKLVGTSDSTTFPVGLWSVLEGCLVFDGRGRLEYMDVVWAFR